MPSSFFFHKIQLEAKNANNDIDTKQRITGIFSTSKLFIFSHRLEYAGNCNQSITVTDSSSLSKFDCSNNNDFLPQVIYTSSGHFMTILFENNLGTTGGKFLIQVKGKVYYRTIIQNSDRIQEITLKIEIKQEITLIVLNKHIN